MTKINIFHDQIEKSMTFQAWKMIFQNSMTFQVFHDPYEPCLTTLLGFIAPEVGHERLFNSIQLCISRPFDFVPGQCQWTKERKQKHTTKKLDEFPNQIALSTVDNLTKGTIFWAMFTYL